jgi:uncharacterized protein (DUF4213/DUF364 family)
LSTLSTGHKHTGSPDVPEAGDLERYSGLELAQYSRSEQPTLASVGMAALNALLTHQPDKWVQANAEEMLATYATDKRLVIVGHFPFIKRLRTRVGDLTVLEQVPGPQDLPAHLAPKILPQAQVVAITAMTLINHTLEELLQFCDPGAFIMVLGPSTPLTPLMFEFGVNLLSGAIVTNVDSVMRVVSQGGNFKQVHRAGVRLVNLSQPDLLASK